MTDKNNLSIMNAYRSIVQKQTINEAEEIKTDEEENSDLLKEFEADENLYDINSKYLVDNADFFMWTFTTLLNHITAKEYAKNIIDRLKIQSKRSFIQFLSHTKDAVANKNYADVVIEILKILDLVDVDDLKDIKELLKAKPADVHKVIGRKLREYMERDKTEDLDKNVQKEKTTKEQDVEKSIEEKPSTETTEGTPGTPPKVNITTTIKEN